MFNSRKKIRTFLIYFVIFTFILLLLSDKNENIKETGTSFSNYLVNESKLCTENSLHSTCFLGKLFCHPGYFEKNCSIRIQPANPWYTDDCPNLNRDVTYSNDLSFELL